MNHCPSPESGPTSRPFFMMACRTALLLLLAGCAAHFPEGTAESLPFTARADSVYISPVSAGAGGVFRLEHKLQRSQGQPEEYVRVWLTFLQEECRRRGQTLVPPLRTDSLACAAFAPEMGPEAWRELYGTVPGRRSRVLQVRGLRLQAVKRNGFLKLLSALNLMDDSRREYGWLELDYEIRDLALGQASGSRLLVSREPDTPWVDNRADRAGRLMVKGAKELARELDKGGSR